MAHGPVNQAWRVFLSPNVALMRISKEEYDILRKDYPDNIITVIRDGSKVTKVLYMFKVSDDVLTNTGYTHQNGRTWYKEKNVTATEYDE